MGIESPTTLTRNCLIAAFVVASLALGGLSSSALAQVPTATPSPMMLPAIAQIQLLPVPGYGPAPLTVGFILSSANPETVLQSFIWNFGDGQVSTLPPTAMFHTYTKPGSYVVTVTATTADGHSASSLAGVVVTQPAR
ncbi:PKD domain-containing protein [Candidatus Binatus sp.]|uniref:PKD domain-containing protein n=1 Tax=Candidatus Binatus sp. TaxID=2811406 RepID=UPI002F924D57